MKERPILFSAPMVRALLDGRKTQTRRVCKGARELSCARDWPVDTCPYGVPGDRLWVREPWRLPASQNAYSGSEVGDLCVAAGYRKPWASIEYVADGWRDNWRDVVARDDPPGRFRQARFMPRWASRILLEITDVRVQRLQDISEEDAIAEGLRYRPAIDAWTSGDDNWPTFVDPRRSYAGLWNHINGAGSWDANPLVWAITFKRVS